MECWFRVVWKQQRDLTCRQKHVLLRDSQTGMWELTVGHASISNSSWEYLKETWLDIHHGGCADKTKTLDMRTGVMEAV